MKDFKLLQGLILLSSFICAGGELNYIENYEESNGEIVYENVLANSEENYYDTPVEIVEEAYIETETQEEYNEPIIEEYQGEISSKDGDIIDASISNGINVYGLSSHKIGSNQSEELSTTNNDNTNSSLNNNTPPTPTLDQNKFYAGLGISAVHYTIKCDCPKQSQRDKSFKGAIAKVGYKVNKFLDIEVRGMKLNLQDRGKVSHAGIFLKPKVPLTPNSNLYTLIGVAKTKSSGKMKKIDAESLAVGTGFEVAINKNFGTFVDYERLIMKPDAPKFDTINTGMTYGF